jgi:cell division protein FtsL
MISFESLTELYGTLNNVPDTDIRSAWNLVNPRSEEAIDKDQCLFFLHILNNRSKGVRVPRTVPASLRATFEKSKPEYSLDSKQATVNRDHGSRSSQKSAFADGYLSRLGIGGRSSGYKTSGTDFSSTKDTDWEEVRLKRELEDLEKQIKQAEEAAERRKKGVEDYSSSRSGLIKRELEQLLDYKEKQLQQLRSGAPVGSSNRDLASAKEEVQLIGAQIQSLKEHLSQKESELTELKAQVATF